MSQNDTKNHDIILDILNNLRDDMRQELRLLQQKIDSFVNVFNEHEKNDTRNHHRIESLENKVEKIEIKIQKLEQDPGRVKMASYMAVGRDLVFSGGLFLAISKAMGWI